MCHTIGAYPSFHSRKKLGGFLPHPTPLLPSLLCTTCRATSSSNLFLTTKLFFPELRLVMKPTNCHACIIFMGRRGGLMVSALDSGSGSLGLSPGRGTALCSWARYFALIVPLSTQVYKWVSANLLLGVTLLQGE